MGYQMKYEINSDKIKQFAANYDWPEICSICCQKTNNRVEISGTGHGIKDIILAIFRMTYELRTWVYVCEKCLQKQRNNAYYGWALGAGMVLVSISLFQLHTNNMFFVMALILLLLSPFAGAIYTVTRNKIPVVWSFKKDWTQIKFRSRRFVEYIRKNNEF